MINSKTLEEYKLYRNLEAIGVIYGYLGGLYEDAAKEVTYDDALKTSSKLLACEHLIKLLEDDVNSDPIDICRLYKDDIDEDHDSLLYSGLIDQSIVFKASSEAIEDILYLLL